MPDGRSLCDRGARPRSVDVDQLSDHEFETYLSEPTDSPACGTCILLADFLRYQAFVMLAQSNGRVHPPTLREGWSQLRETRWHTTKFEEFLNNDFSNDNYDALMFQVDPARVREGVDIENQGIENIRQWRDERR
jgi:hypothetical protein